MNTASIKRPLASLAGLALLALCGCTDHGPVGLYSQELFNKKIALANLTFSSSSTPATVNGGAGSSASNPQGVAVSLMNNGGSATYGPISVTFTASGDGNFNLVCSNHPLDNYATYYPNVLGLASATYGGGNQEIPAGSGTPFALIEGYVNGPNVTQTTDQGYAFHFYVNSSGQTHNNVTIHMAIADALGNTYSSSFLLPSFND